MSQDLKKVLIVEDEKPLSKAMELKLKNANFEPIALFDGQECVDYLKGNECDLILLDLVMPNLNGFEVMEWINDEGIDTPVVIMSNLSQEEDEAKALELGAKKFFVKSDVPIKDIVKYVEKLLKNGSK